jgi:hypothetical protein
MIKCKIEELLQVADTEGVNVSEPPIGVFTIETIVKIRFLSHRAGLNERKSTKCK